MTFEQFPIECEWVSRPGNSVSYSDWTEFSGLGFKSRVGQLSVAISKNPSDVNTI